MAPPRNWRESTQRSWKSGDPLRPPADTFFWPPSNTFLAPLQILFWPPSNIFWSPSDTFLAPLRYFFGPPQILFFGPPANYVLILVTKKNIELWICWWPEFPLLLLPYWSFAIFHIPYSLVHLAWLISRPFMSDRITSPGLYELQEWNWIFYTPMNCREISSSMFGVFRSKCIWGHLRTPCHYDRLFTHSRLCCLGCIGQGDDEDEDEDYLDDRDGWWWWCDRGKGRKGKSILWDLSSSFTKTLSTEGEISIPLTILTKVMMILILVRFMSMALMMAMTMMMRRAMMMTMMGIMTIAMWTELGCFHLHHSKAKAKK